MARPTYNQLHYFHVVASERSLGAAAARLGLSQSTLSEHVRKLEEGLGTALFDRSGRRLRLNETGQHAYEQTQAMFRIGERLLQQFGEGDRAERVLVQVGVASTVSRRIASTRFQPLLRRSDLLVQVRHADHVDLVEELAVHELDVVLSDMRPTDAEAKRLTSRELASSDLVAVAGRTLDRGPDDEPFPHNLDRLPHVAYPKHSRLSWYVRSWMADHGLAPKVAVEVDDVAMMLLAAEEGYGFAIVPEDAAREAVERGAVLRLGSLDGARATIHAIHHDRSTSEIVMELIDSLAGDG